MSGHGRAGTARASAPPVFGPGLPLPTARAGGRRFAVPEMQPRIVPVPSSIPKPTMKNCSSADADLMWKRWKLAHTAALYAYTMVDFVYQASKKSKSWAKCLWYENEYGKYPLLVVDDTYTFDPYLTGPPYLYYWFGDYDTNRMATIRKYLGYVLDRFDDPPKIYCKKGDLDWVCMDGDVAACTWFTNPGRMYFKVGNAETDFFVASTIVHEMTHMDPPATRHQGKCGSKKAPFYGADEAAFLANNCPVMAMVNADNYALLAINLYAAVTWGRWWDGQSKDWSAPFRWGQTCPAPYVGGGGGQPEPCIWSWNSLNQENECLTAPVPPDFGEPKQPGLAAPSPSRRAKGRLARSARRRGAPSR